MQSKVINLPLTFLASTENEVLINCSFNVKRMIIKSIIVADADYVNSSRIGCIVADNRINLNNDKNILISFPRSEYHSSPVKIEFVFDKPVYLNGKYPFFLRGFYGSIIPNAIGDVNVSCDITIELYSE